MFYETMADMYQIYKNKSISSTIPFYIQTRSRLDNKFFLAKNLVCASEFIILLATFMSDRYNIEIAS